MIKNRSAIANLTAGLVCLSAGYIWWSVLIYKYTHLSYDDWDLAFFTQSCWNLLHGSQFSSLVGINYFGDHSYFITYFYLPLFALFPHPLTLVFLKLAAFLFSAYLLFKIFHRKLNLPLSLGLMTAYLWLPANIFAILYEFNPESLSMPFIILTFDAFENRRWRTFWVSAVCLLLIKENFALITAAFGIWGLLTAKDAAAKKQAGLLLAVSLIIFYILVEWLIPHFRQLPTHAFVVRYAYLGKSVGGIFINILLHPQMVLSHIFNLLNFRYMEYLFGVWLIPSMFGLPVLLIATPLWLQHFLSLHLPEHGIYSFYGMTMAPFIFLALYRAFTLNQRWIDSIWLHAVIFILLMLSMAQTLHFQREFIRRTDYYEDNSIPARWRMLDRIPPKEPVIATFNFLAPLSLREGLYSFHKVYDSYYQLPELISKNELNTQARFILPDNVRYALIDFSDNFIVQAMKNYPKFAKQRIDWFLKGWRPLRHEGNVYLYVRNIPEQK